MVATCPNSKSSHTSHHIKSPFKPFACFLCAATRPYFSPLLLMTTLYKFTRSFECQAVPWAICGRLSTHFSSLWSHFRRRGEGSVVSYILTLHFHACTSPRRMELRWFSAWKIRICTCQFVRSFAIHKYGYDDNLYDGQSLSWQNRRGMANTWLILENLRSSYKVHNTTIKPTQKY